LIGPLPIFARSWHARSEPRLKGGRNDRSAT
jgi:hypothetical protein